MVKARQIVLMDYLPIILKTGRPPLEALSGSGSRERAICPRGRIFAHLDEQGHLRLSLLFERRHQQLQQVDIDSDQFTGWVFTVAAFLSCTRTSAVAAGWCELVRMSYPRWALIRNSLLHLVFYHFRHISNILCIACYQCLPNLLSWRWSHTVCMLHYATRLESTNITAF